MQGWTFPLRWTIVVAVLLAWGAVFVGVGAPDIARASTDNSAAYYRYDGDPAYWWWWYTKDDLAFRLLVPSDAATYRDVDLFGVRGIDIGIGEQGPFLSVRRVRSTDVNALWESVRAAWAPVLTNARVTTNSQITTSNGVRAQFRVLEANAGGTAVMIRFVAFTRDPYTVYLTFMGPRSSYSGRAQRAWLEAVNRFEWL